MIFLFAALAAASSAAALRERTVSGDDHPVGNVITLIQNLKKSSVKARESTELTWKETAPSCQRSIVEGKRDITTYRDKKARLAALVQELTTSIDVLAADIDELVKVRDEKQAAKDNATAVRTEENAQFNANSADFNATLAALDMAIATIEASKADASLVQNLRAPNLPGNKIRSLIAQLRSHAKAYDFKSGSVIEVLQTLRDKFLEDMRTAEIAEMNAQQTYAITAQDLQNFIDDTQATIDAKGGERDEKIQALTTANTDLASVKTLLEEAENLLKTTEDTCAQQKTEHEQKLQLIDEGLETMDKAIEILMKVAGHRYKEANKARMAERGLVGGGESFIQAAKVVTCVDPSDTMQAALRKASTFLRSSGKFRSTEYTDMLKSLQTIADKPEGVCRYCDKSPFKTIKEQIQKLIFKLKADQTAEDQHKNWCDREMQENTMRNESKTAKHMELTMKLTQHQADVTSLTADMSELERQIAELTSQMAEETSLRQENKAENEASIKDAEEAQGAVQQALQVIRSYNTKVTAFNAQPSPDTSSPVLLDLAVPDAGEVLNLLMNILTEYSEMEADTRAAEQQDSRSYKTYMDEASSQKATMESDVKQKSNKVDELKASIEALQKRTKQLGKELHAVQKYLADLDHPCGEGESTYEDRKKARSDEIAALGSALTTLKEAFDSMEVAKAQTPVYTPPPPAQQPAALASHANNHTLSSQPATQRQNSTQASITAGVTNNKADDGPLLPVASLAAPETSEKKALSFLRSKRTVHAHAAVG
ncbi:unnamed protein product [Vitrella brassicaformis CCMP3155]|uniref:Kinesin motor domain-containing protein n=1 Tax=Vitrella brassicaformis (strain CCMP3155) TaxID=1169540 RepID=A0A0G4H216_VITBC|nr:unnamed protein product [Vitrella brassicaformis CCMP3155]|eukprot:CEM37667.1 unnamed protein product [Vitrella brassicaformis CCMP3155]